MNPRIYSSIELLKKRNFPKNSRILEIGCKEGGVLFEVARALETTDIYGVDIDKETLSVAARRGMVVQRKDLNTDQPSFPDQFFDIVLMEEVIEHLANPDNSVQEAYRVLKLGGYFLVTTHNLAWWLNRLILVFGYQPFWSECSTRYNVGKFKRNLADSLNGHLRMYTLRALKQLLELYSFKTVLVKGVSIGDLPLGFKNVDKLLSRIPALSEVVFVLAQKHSYTNDKNSPLN